MTDEAKKPLGRILLQQRALTAAELEEVLAKGTAGGASLAPRAGDVSAAEVAALKSLCEQTGLPGIDLAQVCVRLDDLAVVPREIAAKHKLLAVLVRDDRIFIAMAAPAEKRLLDEIEFVSGKRVFSYIALAGPLAAAITAAYELRDRGESFYVGPACPPEVLRKVGLLKGGAAQEIAREASREDSRAEVPSDDLFVRRQPSGERPDEAKTRPRDEALRDVSPGELLSGLPPTTPSSIEPPPESSSRRPVAGASGKDTFRTGPPPPGYPGRPSLPLSPSGPGPGALPVVVDDALGRVGVADEVTETGFGDASSVVVELPTDPNAARVTLPSVLVADEDAATRKVLRRAFEDRGYRVVEASDGVTALRLVKEEAPDLLVLDAMLRELHGFDLAKRLKSSDRYGHIPIVLTSATRRGRRFAEDAKASYGIEELVDKPFHADDVIKPLEAARARARASAEGGAAASAEAERLLAAGIAAYKAGDLERAIDFLVKGTHVDPLAFRLRFHLGLLFGKKGQLFDAIQELETAIDLHGGHFAALKNLALVYQKAGFRNKAIETWEKALAAATDDATRRSIREHLLRLL